MNSTEPSKKEKLNSWLKKVGIGGLIFFTVKGLLWLVVLYFGADSLESCMNK